MRKYIIIGLLFFGFELTIEAQNTVFNNVAIGTDYPAYGAKIKTNFPDYTGSWGRAYFITNETGDQSFFTLGSSGYSANGVSSVTSSYIGKDLDTRYMTFLPNGNIGIGTSNPISQLHLASDQNHSINLSRVDGTYGFRIVRNATEGNIAFKLELQ
nr:hypothetical protein [uncultured Flavobacterium sp.]